jgi:hypothetical protein
VPQGRKAEEWSSRLVAKRDAHRRNALLDFVDPFLLAQLGQVLVRPGVRSDGMPGSSHLLHDFGMPSGVLSDRKKDCLGALLGERLEHSRRMTRPRAIVEREHDFLVAQEVIGLEVLKTEARAAGGVDFDNPRHAERVRIIAG